MNRKNVESSARSIPRVFQIISPVTRFELFTRLLYITAVEISDLRTVYCTPMPSSVERHALYVETDGVERGKDPRVKVSPLRK